MQISDALAIAIASGFFGGGIAFITGRFQRKDVIADRAREEVLALESHKMDDMAALRKEIMDRAESMIQGQDAKIEKISDKYDVLKEQYGDLKVKYGQQETQLNAVKDAIVDVREKIGLIISLDHAKQKHELESLMASLTDRMRMWGIQPRRLTDLPAEIQMEIDVIGAHEAQPKGTSPDMFSEQTDLNGPNESGDKK